MVTQWTDDGWKESGIVLVPPPFRAAFTEHGPRAFLPSVLGELEVEKTQRDFVGRWSPTGSDDYTRSYRSIVKRLQKTAVEAIRRQDPRLGDGDVFERLTIYGERLEMEDIETQLTWLQVGLKKFSDSLALSCLSLATDPEIDLVETTIEVGFPTQVVNSPGVIGRPVRQFARITIPREKRYLVVFSQGRRFARLHLNKSACPWVRTLVRDCEEFDIAPADSYNARCKICFPNIETDSSNSDDA